ncbi:MAG: amidohydrolase [Dehalococcoidia bacterium]|nr:amidohydrolase [Dehalococcoidia bacterium]
MTTANSADLILFNANVLTMEGLKPRVELVAIKGDRIIAVGSNSDCRAFTGDRTTLIDCHGKTVIPGFHDSHLHIFSLLSSLLSLDCSPSAVSSIADIQRLIALRAAETPKGSWVKASDYNEFYLKEKRHPNRRDLDQVATDHPVRLTHRTRHASVLNSLALSMAGISSQTPDPDGGLIDRDAETGEPTGVLFGMESYLSKKVIPPLSAEDVDEGLRRTNELLLASGLTSLADATSHNGVDQWEQFQTLKAEGKLVSRITMMFDSEALDRILERSLGAGAGDDHLRLGMVKIQVDEIRGPLNPPQPVLNEMVFEAHRAGFQVALHAVEENTVEAAISAIEYAQRRMPKADHRHRIEHCSECPPHLFERVKKVEAIVVTQPAFLYFGGERYLQTVDRRILPWLYRVGAFHERQIPLAFSSDAPIIPLNPLIGIYAAVTRKSEAGQVLSSTEAISPHQALRMYTMGGAYACFQENIGGSIAPGKLGDLVVLNADPTGVPMEAIKGITVEKTIIGGKVMWEKR